MAAPTFQAAGTAQAAGAVAITVPWPAHAVDDIAFLVVESGTDVGLATANGFVRIPDIPQTTTSPITVLDVYWCRATSTSMASPVTNASINHIYGLIVTARGALATGDPWNVTSGGISNLNDAALSATGDTTNVADCLVFFFAARGTDNAAAQYSGEACAGLTSLTEQHDAGTATGNGGGLAIWTGVIATAGAYGPLTATLAANATDAFASIALKPAAGGATGTVAVTQDAQTSSASGTETFTATSAQTQAAQTSTASGSVVGPFIGTVAVTQANQTSTATAVETFTGSSAVIQGNQTSTASGLENINGTSATTQDDQTSTAAGVFGSAASGTVATTQADQTSTASGSVVVVISGSGAVTQDAQTSTATAQETFTGTSATTQDDQTGLGVGGYDFFASGTVTQDAQTSTASGIVAMAVTGTVAVTQQDQFATATANGGTVTFWVPQPVGYVFNPAAYVANPAAYVKVGPGDIPPAW